MKFVILFLLMCFSSSAFSQGNTPAEIHLSQKIAKKMQDTLGLTGQQRAQIFQVNVDIHNNKQLVRQQHSNPDSLSRYLQREERKRDSLYLPILGSVKYELYLEKKTRLVNNN